MPVPHAVKGCSPVGVRNGCCRLRSATGTPTPLTAPLVSGSTPCDGGHAALLIRRRFTAVQRLPVEAFYFFLFFSMANTLPKAEHPASKDATPLATFRFENVSAAVFTEQVKTKVGANVDVFHVSLRTSYRSADGEWKYSHSLNRGDLLPAALALMKCYDFITDAKGVPEERQ